MPVFAIVSTVPVLTLNGRVPKSIEFALKVTVGIAAVPDSGIECVPVVSLTLNDADRAVPPAAPGLKITPRLKLVIGLTVTGKVGGAANVKSEEFAPVRDTAETTRFPYAAEFVIVTAKEPLAIPTF